MSSFLVKLVALVGILALFTTSAFGKQMSGFHRLPEDWAVWSRQLRGEREVSLNLALRAKSGQELESRLLSVATPGSPNFRKYLSKSEIASIVGRSDADIERLRAWVSKNGGRVVDVHPHRDSIKISASAANIEKMFSCKLGEFVNKVTSQHRIMATGDYSLPDELSDLVEMIPGMVTFPRGHWDAVRLEGDAAGKPATVTPDTIYSVYQSDKSGSHGSKAGSQAIVGFGNFANFNEKDLQSFFSTYQSNLKGETCGVVYGVNNGDIRPSVEANLDVQYIMAAGTFVNTTEYKISGSADIEDEYLDYTMLVNSQNQPPLVHSISYGKYGGVYDNTTDQRMSYELQKMGISGISVMLASGDNGVGCNTAGTSQEFDYPSTPYITMVGATYLDSVTGKEVGATLSSGGFSKDFMLADWQADAVNAYFQSGVQMPKEDFYRPGRAYPDVAAFGQNVMVIASGKGQSVSGTSCSSPIFAGIIALINHELISAGHSPLGWLNPWLYANPQMFVDIVSGSNPYEKCEGFQAAPGWDPVTGLGTPIYPEMVKAAFAALNAKK